MKRWLLVLVLVLSSAAWGADGLRAQSAGAPPIAAFAPCAWGSPDCNVCVPSAVGAIAALRTHGDAMGFHMNGAPDPTLLHHWEGIQRPMGDGGRHLVVSRALGAVSEDVAFAVVRMATRNDDGLRFRSNRLDPSADLSSTAPPGSDRIVATVAHEPGFVHAGGMQALGHVLAVPFERKTVRLDTGPIVIPGASKVVFYDVRHPAAPVRLGNDVDHTELSDEAGTATLGKLANGHFLLAIGRGNADTLDFYVSDTTDLETTSFRWFDTWHEDELTGSDSEFGNYQTLNFVAQCDGALFMIGMHRDFGATLGRDFVDLFRVSNGVGNDVAIRKVANKHLTCDGNCNLDAAGGAYVDPGGRLYLYGVNHDNDGPDPDGNVPCSGPSCSTSFAEFRPVPHAACDAIENAWAELYDDSGFGDRSLIIDFVDRFKEDYSNFDRAEGFEDKASAVRWCIPPGAALRLWEDKNSCGGSHVDLVGDGAFHSIADLGGFGDETSCAEWIGGPYARAGADRTAQCSGPTTPVQLDGGASVSVEGGTMAFSWQAPVVAFDDAASATPIGRFPLARTTVTLTVSESGRSDVDTVDVGIVDTIAPTIVCPANVVADAAMPAGALVGYANPAAADTCGIRSVVCAAPSGSTFPIGTSTVGCTATDQASHSATCSFTVRVKGPAEQITDLMAAIHGLPEVANGLANSFLVKLQAAAAAVAKGQTAAACNELLALRNAVRAQDGNGITAASAADIIAAVTRIRAALGCA